MRVTSDTLKPIKIKKKLELKKKKKIMEFMLFT